MIKELNFELTKMDVENNLEKIYNASSKGVGIVQILKSLTCLMLCILTLYIGLKTGYLELSFILTICILSVIIFFTGFFLCMHKKKSLVKVFLENINTRKIYLELNSEEENFICKEDIGDTLVHWRKVPKIDNNQHSFLIFTGNNSAYIIPKRIFSSENECNEVWNLIQECFNKSR
ncbi:MAG: YcxB family protein [bacterium]|nr:YcxB family protein [bacterium]